MGQVQMDVEYSFVVPVYNDGYLADAFCVAFSEAMGSYLGIAEIHKRVELIFVDDGSRNNSVEILAALPKKYPFVRVIELSRNFGQHIAIACGFQQARGRLVGRLNIDQQDPPSQIPILLGILEKGDFDVVIGKYLERKSSLVNRFTARIYYCLFNLLTGLQVPQNTSTLRVMNRKYIDAYNALRERTRFPQGLDEWLGFRRTYVNIEHQERRQGKSSYNFFSRSALAIDGILSFSDKPMKLILYAGLGFALAGFAYVVYLVIGKLVYNHFVPGYSSLASLILAGFGLQMLALGISGLYIGRILSEAQSRPLYIVRNTFQNSSIGEP